jgi:signal transduction histidine kinase
MVALRALPQQLHSWFAAQDLRGKITTALLAGALLLGALVTLVSYAIFRHQLIAHTEALLASHTMLEQREVELRLGSMVTLAESLASNTVTANALADSRGRETYLDPLLRNQRLVVPGADITVLDYRGRPAASTQPGVPDFSQDTSFRTMMANGTAVVRVDAAGQPESLLVVLLPIRYRLTNNVEGGVVLRVPMAPLLSPEHEEEGLRIDDAQGQRLVGDQPSGPAFENAQVLDLPAPLDTVGLRLVLTRDKGEALRALDLLLLVFVGIGGLVILGVVLFANAGARFIGRSLGELAAAAEEIAASGRPVARLPVRSGDEFGRLSSAFNTMVDRLGDSYRGLEQRVMERTLELEYSRREAEAAEARIRDRTEQLNAIFALSPDGFVSFDALHRVKYVSPAFKRMTGLDETELVGRDEASFSQRLARECSAQAPFPGVAKLRQAQQAGSMPSIVGQGGAERHLVEIRSQGRRVLEVGLRLSDAETVSQILYFRDVTHETEVDRMKSEFLSTAAHELRTPMASIFGFSELLLSGRLADARKQESLSAIHRQSKLMISIVNELLDLARIDARRGKDFDFQVLALDELLREAISNFKAPEGRAAPALQVLPDAQWVRADRVKLMQALGNVLSNAYKYSPGGGDVVVSVVAPGQAADVALVGIRVVDHGIGMHPDDLARVSERFFRADKSGQIPGTGLGMSIVKEIVELHGGRLELQSAFGSGTTVTLWLPASERHGTE